MISWWCVALEQPWSWEWIPYPGIWIASALPVVLYVRAVRRHDPNIDRRRLALFVSGMFVFWLASDWPLGTLGAGYLASAHVVQFLLYTLVAAPLLMLGTPEWMARRITSRLRIYRVTTWLGNSMITCAILYNVILLSTHAPATVDVLRRSQLGSFAMDVIWLLAGLILWLPIRSPIPEGRSHTPWAQISYLFVTTGFVAIIPASFLTFATTPIYAIYELAPRIGNLTAAGDQQMAGIIMKIATIPITWATIAFIWFRWAKQEAEVP